jgi:hypothetical protein
MFRIELSVVVNHVVFKLAMLVASTSCSNFYISIARHVRESAAKEPTVELRDVWPSGGMSCEVEGCTTAHFKNIPSRLQNLSFYDLRHNVFLSHIALTLLSCIYCSNTFSLWHCAPFSSV